MDLTQKSQNPDSSHALFIWIPSLCYFVINFIWITPNPWLNLLYFRIFSYSVLHISLEFNLMILPERERTVSNEFSEFNYSPKLTVCELLETSLLAELFDWVSMYRIVQKSLQILYSRFCRKGVLPSWFNTAIWIIFFDMGSYLAFRMKFKNPNKKMAFWEMLVLALLFPLPIKNKRPDHNICTYVLKEFLTDESSYTANFFSKNLTEVYS